MEKRCTAADVATAAGVSRATVSYVLNNTPGQVISEKTRGAVFEAASKLGYTPNSSARSLAAGSSAVVLFAVPPVPMGDLTLRLLAAVSDELTGRGLSLALHLESVSGEGLAESVARIRPLGVMTMLPAGRERDELAGVRVVAPPDDMMQELSLTAARLQVSHLQGLGHRRLAYAGLDDPALDPLVAHRRSATEHACREAGLDPPLWVPVSDHLTDPVNLAERLLKLGCTGVCAYNDEVAMVLLQALRAAGRSCPDDLSLVGIDDSRFGAFLDPPLTTVAWRAEVVAKRVVAWAMSSLVPNQLPNGGTRNAGADGPLAELIVRRSTGPARR